MDPFEQMIFLMAFEQFTNAPTWSDLRRIVEQQAILLHPDGEDLLRQLAAAQLDLQSRQIVEEHRALLRRCREAGRAPSLRKCSRPMRWPRPRPPG